MMGCDQVELSSLHCNQLSNQSSLFLKGRAGRDRQTLRVVRVDVRQGARRLDVAILDTHSSVTNICATLDNIIGVGGAIAAGGPGAVFWMWITGVFGIATKYSEAVLAVKYRVQMPNGSYAGGPMYALERGLGQKWLGIIFAVFTCIAAFGIGNMFQANAVVETLKDWVKPESD